MTDTNIDLLYKPFPPFDKWMSLQINHDLWDRSISDLIEIRSSKAIEDFNKAVEYTVRSAAFDTGAIEDLYETDRGFTYSVAIETATWEAFADERNKDIRRFFEAQLTAYELVLDASTNQTPISQTFIRKLHEELCRNQDTYRVLTSQGFQNQPLPKGKYKIHSNHVVLGPDQVFAYAPVLETPFEMDRLINELRQERFTSAHPILQAAYAHYAFVLIHPFADGNGRVSRALASLFLYRAASIPLLIFADQRQPYLKSLREADQGNSQHFVTFVLNRAVETMTMQADRLKFLENKSLDDSLTDFNFLSDQIQEYDVERQDEAALRFINYVADHLKLIETFKDTKIDFRVSLGRSSNSSTQGRIPFSHNSTHPISVSIGLAAFNKSLSMTFLLRILKKDEQNSLISLTSTSKKYPSVDAEINQIMPFISPVVKNRIALWSDKILGDLLRQLNDVIRNES